MKKKKRVVVPDLPELRRELARENYKRRYGSVVLRALYTLFGIAAIAVLVTTLLMPVLRIYGSSMTPTLKEGDIVVSLSTSSFTRGDIISFYYNNKILVKRVIATEGEWVDLDEEGNVYVNGTLLDEPYAAEKAVGECDIELPFQVPDGRVFVMGDHRATSVDSRSTSVGCVFEEQIVGKLFLRVWPLDEIGRTK